MAHKLVRGDDGSLSLERFEREQIPAHLMPKSFGPFAPVTFWSEMRELTPVWVVLAVWISAVLVGFGVVHGDLLARFFGLR
jgi:hypothetical protein